MSKITELAKGQITATDTITIELVEADETPAVVIVRWPGKPLSSTHAAFRLARTLPQAYSLPPSSSWHTSDGSGGCEP